MKKFRLFWKILRRVNADKIIYAFIVNLFIVALVITLIEPGISTYGDGLWYTFVACTTIGFGDFAAVTVIGRVLTVYMVLHEILLVAILPGVIVSYYMEVIHRREQESVTIFLDKLERLPELSKEELDEISKRIKKII
ncbi:MAG: two pore domain potassium channel family protein [Clostridiales bacterium]|nr:two pore domain potassium channel family protein [Clostridiales bacterium]